MQWDKSFTYGWVAILALLLGYELWALLDHNTHTPSLTGTVVRYCPAWVTLPFVGWLFIHFAVRYFDARYMAHIKGLVK